MIIALIGSNGRMGKSISIIAQQRNHKVIPIDIDSIPTNSIKCDAIIDFSSDKALDTTINIALQNNCPLVLGVTTYSQNQAQRIKELSKKLSVSLSSNYSVGINAVEDIIPELLRKLSGWQCEVDETHHINKIDKPSGTAITIQKIINNCNHNCTITSKRNDDTIGKHTIILKGDDEQIEITHTANNRRVFALGAVITAEKLVSNNKQN